MLKLGRTGREVFPLCLGSNVFGWTADRDESFTVLDAYVEAGGDFIDTADSYSAWVDGNQGGEAETIIGKWCARSGRRDSVVLATKVGQHPKRPGLGAENIEKAVDESLHRLGTDRIDLLYAHADDPAVPLEETLSAFDALVRAGKVLGIGASNYAPARLREALDISAREGLAAFTVLQPPYNLVERAEYEGGLAQICEAEQLACVPYYGLAKGFLTGKYQPGEPAETRRGDFGGAAHLEEEKGRRAISVLTEIAAEEDQPPAAVALAWLLTRPAVAAPVASARTAGQVRELTKLAHVRLRDDQRHRLDEAC